MSRSVLTSLPLPAMRPTTMIRIEAMTAPMMSLAILGEKPRPPSKPVPGVLVPRASDAI